MGTLFPNPQFNPETGIAVEQIEAYMQATTTEMAR